MTAGIIADGAVRHRQRAFIINATASTKSFISTYSTVRHGHRTKIIDAAAKCIRKVLTHGAVVERQRGRIEDTAAIYIAVVIAYGAVRHRHRASIVNATARFTLIMSSALNGHICQCDRARFNSEHGCDVIAINNCASVCRAVDGHIARNSDILEVRASRHVDCRAITIIDCCLNGGVGCPTWGD